MPGTHCESEDKENTQNVRPAPPAKTFEQKDLEIEKLRRENEKLCSELEKLRNENIAAAETVRAAASFTVAPYGPRVHRPACAPLLPWPPNSDGVVRKWRPATEDGGSQFHVEHDDGDEEALDEEELEAAIAAYAVGPTDLGLSVDPRSSRWTSLSQRRGVAALRRSCCH